MAGRGKKKKAVEVIDLNLAITNETDESESSVIQFQVSSLYTMCAGHYECIVHLNIFLIVVFPPVLT